MVLIHPGHLEVEQVELEQLSSEKAQKIPTLYDETISTKSKNSRIYLSVFFFSYNSSVSSVCSARFFRLIFTLPIPFLKLTIFRSLFISWLFSFFFYFELFNRPLILLISAPLSDLPSTPCCVCATPHLMAFHRKCNIVFFMFLWIPFDLCLFFALWHKDKQRVSS